MCVFCKIVRGEAPAFFVHKGDRVVAFLDKYPFSWGHVLVVPREHYQDIHDTPVEVLQEMIALAKLLARAVKEVTGALGIKVVMNNGREAGQEIFHSHLHVIPYGVKLMNRRELTKEEGEELAARLRDKLKELELSLGAPF